MTQFVEWIKTFALALGGPGLFIIAFLDSSILSLPEINDLLIIWMVARHKERLLLYATMATLGSIAGCVLMYWIGAKGGDALLRRRFNPQALDRAMSLSRRYGLLAVLIPSILPPPAPFKIFVLLAGVARVPLSSFVSAIALGRGVRYFAEGFLAIRYGDSAIEYLRANGPTVAWILVGLLAVCAVAYVAWSRRSHL